MLFTIVSTLMKQQLLFTVVETIFLARLKHCHKDTIIELKIAQVVTSLLVEQCCNNTVIMAEKCCSPNNVVHYCFNNVVQH